MTDLKTRIQALLKEPLLAVLATVTEGKPWARYVMAVTDSSMNLRFATFAAARKVTQITACPEVHLTCGVNNPLEMKPYLQIQGKARFSNDKTERHDFWNPMLINLFEGPDDPNYGVIIVEPYRIELCSPGSHKPEVWNK